LWSEFRQLPPEDRLDGIMELQRVVAMSTTQGRVVAKDFTWRGHDFKKDQLVYLMVAGANRDPKVFENPERIDFHRPQHDNVVFGPGLHHCIGHLLAKMQLTEFFPALVDRFDGMQILDDELDWGTMIGFRGLQSLRVRMIPRARASG
jgi:cytochrome P450